MKLIYTQEEMDDKNEQIARLELALRDIADDAKYLMYDTNDCTFDALRRTRNIAKRALNPTASETEGNDG